MEAVAAVPVAVVVLLETEVMELPAVAKALLMEDLAAMDVVVVLVDLVEVLVENGAGVVHMVAVAAITVVLITTVAVHTTLVQTKAILPEFKQVMEK
jgi:hypothetical protein